MLGGAKNEKNLEKKKKKKESHQNFLTTPHLNKKFTSKLTHTKRERKFLTVSNF